MNIVFCFFFSIYQRFYSIFVVFFIENRLNLWLFLLEFEAVEMVGHGCVVDGVCVVMGGW